jgi:hypothetical protein
MKLETLRAICALHWNPIGIPMNSECLSESLKYKTLPTNEYDGYLNHVLRMIESGKEANDIIEYLSVVETDYIGLSEPSGDKAEFVKEAIKLYKAEI